MKHLRPKFNSAFFTKRCSRITKVSILFMFLFVNVLSAATSYSQNTRLTLKMNNKALKDVFYEIEKSTEYIFFYNDEAVDVDKKVNVSVNNGTIYEVLDEVLDHNTSNYTVSDRQVIIYRNSNQNSINMNSTEIKEVLQTQHAVRGKVTDEKGVELIGVSIIEKGTTNGVVSDLEGNYSISVKSPNATLVFSYVSYEPTEVSVNGKNQVDVKLKEQTSELGEVVVVAYGTQRRNTVSGSLSTLKTDQITATAPTISAMLQGQVAGMNVNQTTGRPGEGGDIIIRGRGSISSTVSPLWVVDGVVGGTTSSLNPNDIESITVLKDGSATALYGSRGANGAIVVTTKSARLGENKIDASIKVGFTNLSRGKFKMMNSNELYEYTETLFKNSNEAPYSYFTPALKDNDTDWFDIATQTGMTTNYNVTYRTGTEKMRSYTSVDYYKEEGAVKGYEYERYTVRNNMTYKFNDRLNINTSIAGNYSNTSDKQRSLYAAFTYFPWDTPYNSLGEIKTGKEGTDISTEKSMSDYWFGRDQSNYLYDLQTYWLRKKGFGVDLAVGFDYTIMDGLVFESKNNFGYSNTIEKEYVDPKSQSGASDGGTIREKNSYTRNRYTNQLLRYNKNFDGIHEVSAFLGHEYSDNWVKFNELTGKGIPQGGGVPGVASEPKSINGDEYFNTKTEGYYFNANYTYDNKYFGQFSFRRDGSSKFGKDKRYGNFWTVGGGWNLHNEEFFKNEIVNMLRLRASYGVTGNTPGGTFYSIYLYDLNREYDLRPGAFPKQMGNREMSWETTKSTNVGIDTRFLDRIGLGVDFYIKNVSGLLYERKLSTLSGYEGVWLNEGRLQNMGLEVTLSPEIIKTKDWNWTINLNFAYNKNEIKSLADGKQLEINGNNIREVGYSLGTYYMREWGGVDIMTGNPTWIAMDEEGNKSWVLNSSDASERNLDKTRYPDFTGGIQSRLTYKDFTLAASFAFATGFYINHSGRETYDNDGAESNYNAMKLKEGWSRWEKPGDKATHPRPMLGGNAAAHRGSSRFLERGDFFKMKSLALSYNVPRKVLGNFGLHSAQIGFSADNLFTLTEFSGIDPEIAAAGQSYTASVYPLPRKYMFTLSLGF